MIKRVKAYIDGFNLDFGTRSAFGRRYLWLDLEKLISFYLDKELELKEVKYFTSKIKPTIKNPKKPDRQNSYLDALASKQTKIFYGEYLTEELKCYECDNFITSCPKCGKTIEKFQEKKTDVNIASEMIVDALKDKFDIAFLVSGDRDLSTPVEKIKRIFHSKKVNILFPPHRATYHLKKICDKYQTISEESLRKSQFPDEISYEAVISSKSKKETRVVITRRPASWK